MSPTVSSSPSSTADAPVVSPATPNDRRLWDDFIHAHPEGRFCQLWGFRETLQQTYGYQCSYSVLRKGSEVIGVVPAAVVRRAWSRRMVSQPFNEYGGPLFLPEASPEEVGGALYRIVRANRCASMEIRGGVGCEGLEQSPYCTRQKLYSFAVVPLLEKEQLWRKSLTNEARKGVNKSRSAGLTFEIRTGADTVADPFYSLYLMSMKRLGVPPHPRKFFTSLVDGIGDTMRAAWIKSGNDYIAALLGFQTGHRLQVYITVSHPEHWPSRPNDLAQWELMAWAADAGLKLFDFGSVRYTGQAQFKKKWGAVLHDYSVYIIAEPGSSNAGKIRSPESSSRLMQTMASIWSKAVPLPVTRIVGPSLRRVLTK